MRLSHLITFFALLAFAKATKPDPPSDESETKLRCKAATDSLRRDPDLIKCSFFTVFDIIDEDSYADPVHLKKKLTKFCSTKACDQAYVENRANKYADACNLDAKERQANLRLAYLYTPIAKVACYDEPIPQNKDDDNNEAPTDAFDYYKSWLRAGVDFLVSTLVGKWDMEYTLVTAAINYKDSGTKAAICNESFLRIAESVFNYSAERLPEYNNEILSAAARVLLGNCGMEFSGGIKSAGRYLAEAEVLDNEPSSDGGATSPSDGTSPSGAGATSPREGAEAKSPSDGAGATSLSDAETNAYPSDARGANRIFPGFRILLFLAAFTIWI